MGKKRKHDQDREHQAELDRLENTIMSEPWYHRLNELQSRWVPDTEENKIARKSLMPELVQHVYEGCLQYAQGKYDEFACSDAMMWVIGDLKNYNPDLQPLGNYVSYHIRSRMSQAYTRHRKKESLSGEFSVWNHQMKEMGRIFPEDLTDHSAWVEEVYDITYAEHWKSFERFPPERKKQILQAVKTVIGEYRPGEQKLLQFMETELPARVCRMLGLPEPTEKTARETVMGPRVILVSAHKEEDDEGDGILGNIPDTKANVEEKVEKREEAQAAVLALVLNFTELKKQSRDAAVRHYRLFYTEQIAGSAKIRPLPEKFKKDILKALHHPYFRYFMADVDEPCEITLQTIRRALPKKHGEVISGKPMEEYLSWDEELFLPAKVQLQYLEEREQTSVSPATVSTRKKEYKEALMGFREC